MFFFLSQTLAKKEKLEQNVATNLFVDKVLFVPTFAESVSFFHHQLFGLDRIAAEEVVGGAHVADNLRLGTVALGSVAKFEMKKVFLKGIESAEKIS